MEVFNCCLLLSLHCTFTFGLLLPLPKLSGDSNMTSIVNHITLMEQVITSLQTQVQRVETKLQTTENELKSVKAKDTNVSFQVTQLGLDSKGDTTLKFNTVDYNIGSGYDSSTGNFTAPVSGTYICWASVEFYYVGGENDIFIYKGERLLVTAADKQELDDDSLTSASVTAVTPLHKGDKVHFERLFPDDANPGSGSSSYGGALLHAS